MTVAAGTHQYRIFLINLKTSLCCFYFYFYKNLIEEFITEIKYSPEIIGISETTINSNTCLNLNIPNFDFFRNDSPTNAEGVGIIVNQSLKYKIRNDLLFNVPNCEDI